METRYGSLWTLLAVGQEVQDKLVRQPFRGLPLFKLGEHEIAHLSLEGERRLGRASVPPEPFLSSGGSLGDAGGPS